HHTISMNDNPRLFLTHPAATDIYTLSLHDALPICQLTCLRVGPRSTAPKIRNVTPPSSAPISSFSREASSDSCGTRPPKMAPARDRKSTRLNSSHDQISYAVFCLKKKNND